MEIRWTFALSLLLIFGVILFEIAPVHSLEELDTSTDLPLETDSEKSQTPPFGRKPFMRRRVVRKKIINNNGENGGNSSNVSVSMSVTAVEEHTENQSEKENGLRRPLFSRLRSMNRTRPTFMTTPVGIPTTTSDPMETPNTSFKLTMRPRLPFGRIRTTANSITEEEEEKHKAKSSATLKPFARKRFFKQTPTPTATTSTTTEEPTLEEVDDDDIEDEGEAEPETKSENPENEEHFEKKSASAYSDLPPGQGKNSSMIIIPVPPAQRKPYHPVIMQVTKTPTTAESLPETKVVTYKLNKMFVPMGIYGKVLPKVTSPADKELVSRNTVVSTPLPFVLSGQDDGSKKKGSKSEKRVTSTQNKLKSPSPEIKVKGHRSKEVVEDQMISADSSRDYATAVAYANTQKEHHTRQLRQWESMMQKLKEKHRKNIVDTISLTYDYKPTLDHVSLTTEKVNVGDISLTTEKAPVFDIRKTHPSAWGNMKQDSYPSASMKNGFHELTPPQAYRPGPPSPPKSIFQTITSAASSIPGLIHDGLTSMTSYPSPFEDDSFQSSSQPVQSKVPPNFAPQSPSAEAETLEFFRKRPYLLNKNRGGRENFIQPEYSSGFKPVTAPVHFASQYYASTPKPTSALHPTTPTVQAYFAEPREPLHESSQIWPTSPTIRTSKQFSNPNDIYSWRGSSSLSAKHPLSGFGFTSSTTARPSYSFLSSTPKSFTSQWMDFNRKYTKSEIEEAKERIFNMFAQAEASSSDSMAYLKAPESKQSASSGAGAFDDLLKMFKMGVSFGAGHTSSDAPMVSYNAGMYNEDSHRSGSSHHDSWKPLPKPTGSSPVISLNAGITFGGKPSPTAMYGTGHGASSHYSSSTKPYLPRSQYKEFFNPGSNHYSGSKIHPTVNPHPTSAEYLRSAYDSFKRPETTYKFSEKPERPTFSLGTPSESLSNSYFKSSDLKPIALGSESYSPKHYAALKSHYSNDPAIEIIPSSVFFRQKGNMADIAAIIKPPELSSDLVKAALPPQIASVPQLSYPTQQLIQNPHSFTSLSQLQHYFATAQPSMHPTALYNPLTAVHQINQAQAQPGQFLYLSNGKIVQQSGIPQLQHNYVPAHNSLRPSHQSSSQGGGINSAGDPMLGFSDFQLPAGLDPDIASLIKTELEKDDVPDEYRQDFANAKEEEKSKKQSQTRYHHGQQPQAAGSSLRVTVLKPSATKSNDDLDMTNRRADKSKLDIKFHKPVPITPTMLTPVKGKPIRASPVPRYVVELARKLKNEKDVQGIVRVSTKRERGPPVEYLYPVRG